MAAARVKFQPLKIDFSGGKSTEAQAQEILDAFQAVPEGGPVGITYSANHDQTQALNAFYKNPTDAGWTAVTNTFAGAANQGAVIRDLLGKLNDMPLADRANFRVLPISTMTATGGAPDPAWVQQNLADINSFIQNDKGMVLGWKNQNTPDGQYAIGGGVSTHFNTGTPLADYVQNHLQALANANNLDDLPKVEDAPGAASTPTPGQEAEKQRRANEAAEWGEYNKALINNWINVLDLPKAEKEADVNAAVTVGADKSPGMLPTGYYKGKSEETKDLRTFKYDAESKSVSMCGSGTYLTYKDYANGRNFLQSQGATSINFDYGNNFNSNPSNSFVVELAIQRKCKDTVDYLMDSIFKDGWQKGVDNNGFAKPGAVFHFKEPPLAINLGKNLHDFIDKNLHKYDPTTGKGSRAGKLAYRMLELEKLSQQNRLKYDNDKAQEAKKTPDKDPAAPDLVANQTAPGAGPGGGAAGQPVAQTALVEDLPKPQNATILPEVKGSGPAQLPPEKDQGDRLERLKAEATKMGEAIGRMAEVAGTEKPKAPENAAEGLLLDPDKAVASQSDKPDNESLLEQAGKLAKAVDDMVENIDISPDVNDELKADVQEINLEISGLRNSGLNNIDPKFVEAARELLKEILKGSNNPDQPMRSDDQAHDAAREKLSELKSTYKDSPNSTAIESIVKKMESFVDKRQEAQEKNENENRSTLKNN